LTVVAVFWLARTFGASLLGASVGALALASVASFWFNAGFAKHYAFSGLLVTVAALAVSLWQTYAKAWLLAVAGMLLGIGIGASWELAVVMAAGLVALVWFGPRRPQLLTAGVAFLTLFAFAVASLALMIVRARQHPAIDWGEVTSTRRLFAQITQRDFQASNAPSTGSTISSAPSRFMNYIGIVVRDLGLGACVIAAVGVVAALRIDRGRKLFLAVVAALNLLAVAFATGVDHISGFFTGIFAGGFVIDVLVVMAVLVALGTEPAIEWASNGIARLTTSSRSQSRLTATVTRLSPFVAVGVVAVVLLPSVLVHHRYADHRMPPLADRYGARVLAELPRRAVLVVGAYELSQPMRYRQIVAGERPDVLVVSSDLLGLAWYRDQVSRALGAPLPHADGSNTGVAVALMKQLRSTRPVFVDTIAMYYLGSSIGYRAQGFVGEVVDGTGAHAAIGTGVTAADLDRADRADGLGSTRYNRFPNEFAYYFHQRAHIELAKQLWIAGDKSAVEQQLERALDLVPNDTNSHFALEHLRDHDPKIGDIILSL
jgi:hypothetical protein